MYPQSMFCAKIRKILKKFLLKIFIFYNFKNPCIPHGHVFVMSVDILDDFSGNIIIITVFKSLITFQLIID